MKVGDLVNWYHEYTGERSILYVTKIIDGETVRCLFPYGAHQDINRSRLTMFKDVDLHGLHCSERSKKKLPTN
jgi:hypothetical protein